MVKVTDELWAYASAIKVDGGNVTTNEMQDQDARGGGVDFTMMYASHDAFRRDVRRLGEAARTGRAGTPAVRAGWQAFKTQLHIHHQAEDEVLWPALREALVNRPGDLALLDAMEAEHAGIDPMLARIDATMEGGDDAKLAADADVLRTELGAHLAHEEDEALPLIAEMLGEEGWAAFGREMRNRQGIRGAGAFLRWLLDDARPDTRRHVLGMLPPPARLVYRILWQRDDPGW